MKVLMPLVLLMTRPKFAFSMTLIQFHFHRLKYSLANRRRLAKTYRDVQADDAAKATAKRLRLCNWLVSSACDRQRAFYTPLSDKSVWRRNPRSADHAAGYFVARSALAWASLGKNALFASSAFGAFTSLFCGKENAGDGMAHGPLGRLCANNPPISPQLFSDSLAASRRNVLPNNLRPR